MKKEEIKNQIQVGDRVTYRFLEDDKENMKHERQSIMTSEEEIVRYTTITDLVILKIERIGRNGWYTVYEKELLTEEEKD